MALVVKDRVKETTSTTGTGTLTLAGAVTKFQSFSVVGDGNTTYYAIESGNGTDWEVGVGTYTASGTTLSRDTILESSNAGSAINLSGTSTVFCTYPAERSVNTADIGTTIQAYDATILKSADIGSTVQGYDADTAKYDDTTANFTGTLQNGGSNVVVDTDIGSTVQAYDADTTKNDVANTFTANQTINGDLTVDTDTLYVDSTNNRVGIGTSSPSSGVKTHIYTTTATNAPTLKIEQSSTSYNAGVGMFNGNSTNGFNILVDGNGGAQIRQNDNNYMVFATNNAERMRIDSSGNVGIGTSSPDALLTVNTIASFGAGAASAPSIAAKGDLDTGMYFPGANQVALSTAGNVRLSVSSSGTMIASKYNGTAASPTESADWPTPILALRGYGNFSLESMLSFGYSNDAAYQTGGNVWNFRLNGISSATTSSSSTHLNLSGPGQFYLYSGGDAIFSPASAERMRITSTGKVGIGTSSPSAGLEIRSSSGEDNRTLRVAYDGTYYANITQAGAAGLYYRTYGGTEHHWQQNGTECMFIDASANLKFNSGYGSVATAYGCRAWVNFNGTGTVAIRASGNVSSITDNGTGDYTVNFTTAMPDANYSVTAGIQGVSGSVAAHDGIFGYPPNNFATPTTSSFRISTWTFGGVSTDFPYVLIHVVR